MEEDLRQFADDFTTEFSVDTPINSLWTSFKTKSLSSINKHVPSKMTYFTYSQSWCNRTVRRLSRRKHRAFRKARQNSSQKNWTRYKNLQKSCKESARRPTMIMSVIWSVTNPIPRNCTPSSKIRNVTAPAWPR